jgi:AcrR family transcriptional regulator
MTSDRRSRLVRAAQALFLEQGFRATGIDAILAAAGVAKMTLYNHFGSKDALIHEVLTQHDAEVRRAFVEAMNAAGGTPKNRIFAAFDHLTAEIASPDFKGGLFIRAAYEDTEPSAVWREAAAEHKRRMVAMFELLLREMRHPHAAVTARCIVTLIDGARVAAYAAKDAGAGMNARRMAELLLAA